MAACLSYAPGMVAYCLFPAVTHDLHFFPSPHCTAYSSERYQLPILLIFIASVVPCFLSLAGSVSFVSLVDFCCSIVPSCVRVFCIAFHSGSWCCLAPQGRNFHFDAYYASKDGHLHISNPILNLFMTWHGLI